MMGEPLSPGGSTNVHAGAAPTPAPLDHEPVSRRRERLFPLFPAERAEHAIAAFSRFAGPAAFMLALGALGWWAFF